MQYTSVYARRAEATVTYNNDPYTGTLFTAVGDVIITKCSFYVVAAFTSAAAGSAISIQTDDTTPTVFMTLVEGDELALTAKTQMLPAFGQNTPFHLRSGQKLQYTVDGENQTAGSGKVFVEYIPVTSGYLI